MKKPVCCVCLVIVCVFGARAQAQTNNYQSRLLGQRALGMGGAFAAIADDPSASWYNPAALSNLSQLQLEVGLPIIGLDLQRVAGGLVPAPAKLVDVSALQALTLPTMVGAATVVGPKDEDGRQIVTLAVSLMIPWQRNVAFKQTVQTSEVGAFHLVQENEQTLFIGGSASLRLGPLSFGASLYYVHENVSWLNARSGTLSTCTEAGCSLQSAYNLSSLVEAWFGAINPRLGVLVKVNNQLSIGMMASLSSFRVFGSGAIKTGLYALPQGLLPMQLSYESNALRFNRPQPWELKFGVGWQPRPGITFSADVTLYAPDAFTMIAGIDQSYLSFPAVVRRQAIGNTNLGFEFYVRPTVPIRFGLFTNLSSAPAVVVDSKNPSVSTAAGTARCRSQACDTWMHYGGATTSVGFNVWRVQIDVGLNISYGRGYKQQVSDLVPPDYRWSLLEHFQAQLFIGGNIGKMVSETANSLVSEIAKQANKADAARPASVPKEKSGNSDAPADSDSPRERSPK